MMQAEFGRTPSLESHRIASPGPLQNSAGIILDVIIALNAFALILIVMTGGIVLPALSLMRAEKPILALIIAIPLRITLGGASRLLWISDATMRRWYTALRTGVFARIPSAVKDVAFAFIVTRPIGIVVAFVANLMFTPHRGRPFALPFESQKMAEVFAAWDSGWYFDIASRGYYFREDGQSSIAFFPLYPMLMRIVGWAFGGSDRALWLAGIAISWVAFTLSLLVLHRLTERLSGSRQVARRTVLYLAVFPFSVFFTRVYAESVFLLTTVLSISRAYDQRWGQAGLWGALAALARPNGILIVIPLFFLTLQGRPPMKALARRWLAVAWIPLALVGYCAYAYWLTGHPLAWLAAQAHWGYSLGHPPWHLLLNLIGRLLKYGPYDYFFISSNATFYLFHGIAAIVFLVLTPAVFKRLGTAMGAYVLVSLLVPLSGNALEGVGRYASVLFPVFMVMGMHTSPRLHEGLLIGGSLCRALVSSLFSTGYPIY